MSEENNFSGNIDDLITPEFDAWWEESGQFIRSGGDSYNRSFAYGAFRHLMPEILAAREAKKTPVWTSADQKAGKLPDFLSKIVFTGGDEPEIVEYLGDAGEGIWYFRRKCGSVTFAPVGYLEPIETEAERQQREWIKKAKDITPVYDATEFGYLDQLHIVLSRIHDALQSGELKMPEVRK